MRGRGNVGKVGKVRNVRNDGTVERWAVLRPTCSLIVSLIPSFFSLASAISPAARFPTFRAFPTFLRRIAGMPDYRAHVEHLRRCHPDSPIPSEREFFDDYLQRRYQNGATRCC